MLNTVFPQTLPIAWVRTHFCVEWQPKQTDWVEIASEIQDIPALYLDHSVAPGIAFHQSACLGTTGDNQNIP